MVKKRVLIIDDEIGALTLIGIMLERGGFQVYKAKDGLTGLILLPETLPHLIITDIMMPGMLGFEICQRIRDMEKFGNIPILILSARGDVDSVMRGMEAGANDYLPKPILHGDLVSKVRAMLTDASFEWGIAPESEEQRLARFMNLETDPYMRLSLFEWFREHGMSLQDELAAMWNDPSSIIRQMVAKYIRNKDTELSVSILLKLLKDEHWEVRKQAVSSIYRFYPEKPHFADHIINLINDDVPEVRREVVKSLYIIKNTKIVRLLVNVLHTDDDHLARVFAVQSLYKINNKRAADALIAAAHHKDAGVRIAIVNSLDQLKGRHILAVFKELLVDDDPNVREATIRVLLQSNKRGTKKLLATMLLKDEAGEISDVSLSYLKLYRSKAISHLIRDLGKKYSRLFTKIGKNLEQHVDLLQILADQFTSDKLSVRGAAMIELSKLRREDETILRDTLAQDAFWRNVYHSLGSLSPRAAEEKWGELSELAMALTKEPDEQNRMLREIIETDHVEMKIHALKALGLNQDDAGLGIIIESASHENSRIRAAAIEALGMLKNDESIPALQNAVQDSSVAVTYAAVNALATIGTPQALTTLQEIMGNSDRSGVRIDIIKAVVRPESSIDSDAAFNLIAQIIDDEQNNDVLYAATRSLSYIEKPESIAILEKLSQHDSDHVRKGANIALEKLNSGNNSPLS